MKFDDLFYFDYDRLAEEYDTVEYKGGENSFCLTPGYCWHCGKPTNWIDINFIAFLCSTECSDAKWHEYSEACRN